jgi:hypothetical protein
MCHIRGRYCSTIAKADTPAWRNNAYQNVQPQPYDTFESDFGLPENFNLNTPPEVAFPPSPPSDLSFRAQPPVVGGEVERAAFSRGAEGPSGAKPDILNPFRQLNYQYTAGDMELDEIKRSQGMKAMLKRVEEFDYDDLRRKRRAAARLAHERFAAPALQRNIELAAQKLAEEKLAPAGTKAQESESATTAKKPPAASTAPSEVAEAKPSA